ncbi:sulfate/thiosulfate ABC transporter ATP-binding protein CysA [Blochmannia endosymbiont of Camponotus (Colobopsis) obliquus]|uniref:sulfate/thiosulfate ABC transporter ATP-binding protein CysA n=1 Tax=Blochmannia endosymbiont of Camponotus (Colobopsis) obliquus TaxID=1505597 RepID=UPI00061A771C|nr:sulfate/thiosulfate ABC transporter ATP-binding protein CysA [Blochmannia endosymbiont of Camponotus (Colobopsis) obliquus]AKC60658.1 Sulfate/thiosulfate import ATP-binding protein CysA [Blochmannia endosymbiont of Camponotus (Colobopsis) obliquus]
MSIEISKISKNFNKIKILNNISLKINSGEMVALLGPSGSGKTTLLRIIAGLEYHNSGSIIFAGQDVSDVHARDRQVGFVFQHYALFRHMTVIDNISFGIKMLPRYKRPTTFIIKRKVNELLEMIQLSNLAHRYPAQLSGGQKQRVALARALAVNPKILLLDEPFGALDVQVRKELRRWLCHLHKELQFTSIFVTHDQEEAMEVANRIVVMNHGNIEQIGTPQDVWCAPASRFVLEFLGDVNKLIGEIRGSRLFVGEYHLPLLYTPAYQGQVEVFFRPWEMIISEHASLFCFLPVQIVDVSLRGYYYQLSVQPLGYWHKGILSVVIVNAGNNNIPKLGDCRYISGQNARLYVGERAL